MSVDRDAPPVLHTWIGVVGLIIAPTTLVTSLCYYFGYVSTRKAKAYLGINSDAIGFTTNDYVTKSAGVLFVTVLTSLVVCAGVLGVCAYFRRLARAGRRLRLLRNVAWTLVGVGVVCAVRGVVGVWRPGLALDKQVWLTPVALGLGAALLMLAFWMFRTLKAPSDRSPLSTAERALFAVAVAILVLALFWTTNLFATKAGEVDGINAAGELWWKETTVILDTPDRLFLPKELVTETPLTSADSPQGETFRYECLRVHEVRGDKWVLLPANWRPQFGYAVFVTTDASHRIMLRTIKDAPERTGGGANVREYWPCPELVPTATGPQAQAQLLTVEEVNGILRGDGLIVNEYTQLPQGDTSPSSSRNCAGAVDSTAQPAYRDSGFITRYVRELTPQPTSSGRRVIESVIDFDTPHHADDFIQATKSTWRECAHTGVSLSGRGSTENYTLGDFAEAGDIAIISVSSADDPPTDCSHALAAKSNVVVDVNVCGSDAPAHAVSLVEKIRERFPS